MWITFEQIRITSVGIRITTIELCITSVEMRIPTSLKIWMIFPFPSVHSNLHGRQMHSVTTVDPYFKYLTSKCPVWSPYFGSLILGNDDDHHHLLTFKKHIFYNLGIWRQCVHRPSSSSPEGTFVQKVPLSLKTSWNFGCLDEFVTNHIPKGNDFEGGVRDIVDHF